MRAHQRGRGAWPDISLILSASLEDCQLGSVHTGLGLAGRPAPFDLPGFALAGASLSTLMYALSKGPSHGWRSPLIISTGLTGIVLLATVVWPETRKPQPNDPPRIGTRRISGWNVRRRPDRSRPGNRGTAATHAVPAGCRHPAASGQPPGRVPAGESEDHQNLVMPAHQAGGEARSYTERRGR